jgi:rhodanese-related sulfurtransferase
MKVNVKKCLIIILASSILGLIYNFVNPSGISLISKRKQVKWASDSIILSSLKPVDTFQSNLETKTLEEAKSPINKKSDNLISKLKSDSTRQKLPKPIIKSNIDEDQGFSEPIGINLEQAYKLYTRGIIFIDARDESEYKTGHIKNSINLSIYDFDKHKNVLSGISKSQTIVCYCGGTDCDLSTQLANKLFALGYRNNYIFIGGLEQWKTGGYSIE